MWVPYISKAKQNKKCNALYSHVYIISPPHPLPNTLFKLTIAAVEVCVGAGSAVLWSQVNLRVKVVRHGGISLLTGGLLRVERHFGTFNDDIVDFILFPPKAKNK